MKKIVTKVQIGFDLEGYKQNGYRLVSGGHSGGGKSDVLLYFLHVNMVED